MEAPIAGRVGEYGEVVDFPTELGHFASAFVGAAPDAVFALAITKDIPEANILAGDLIIFDLNKKPQPGDICIGPIGQKLFRIKIDSKTYESETFSPETAQSYPIPKDLAKPELKQMLNWYPVAYNDETQALFTQITEEQNWVIGPLAVDLIVATALRLSRTLAF